MRSILILATTVTIAIAAPAFAQDAAAPATPATPPTAEAPAAEAPAASQALPAIQSISVVDKTELPPEALTEVEEIIAGRTEEQQQEMRRMLDAEPQFGAALEAKGKTSGDVVVASLTQNGQLILVTD